MKTIYLDDIKKANERKFKKIAKKLYKMSKKEDIVVALSKNLRKQEELNREIENYRN